MSKLIGKLNVFVTGGAGYIGAHICVELLNAGHDVTVYDNFSNSSKESLRRVEGLTARKLRVIEGDVRDEEKLFKALFETQHCVVLHLAGLKAVRESVDKPIDYYDNNVLGTLSLVRAMRRANMKRIVFSSSATVYGAPKFLPLTEEHPLSPTNTYGRTKFFTEEILRDLFVAEPDWCISILRYFNPVGAHASGLIGEDPIGTPGNLMPFLAQVAVGRREKLYILGQDYSTPDGTGIRDYIHVVDLAQGHLCALEKLDQPQCIALNLGTGRGHSVLEIVKTFQQVSGVKINYEFAPRRQGDVDAYYAQAELAEKRIEWQARRNLIEMCEDVWRWQSMNPEGYINA